MEQDVSPISLYNLYCRGAELFEEIQVVPNLSDTVRRLMLEKLWDVMRRIQTDSVNDNSLMSELREDEEFLGTICAIYKIPNSTTKNRLHLMSCLVPTLDEDVSDAKPS